MEDWEEGDHFDDPGESRHVSYSMYLHEHPATNPAIATRDEACELIVTSHHNYNVYTSPCDHPSHESTLRLFSNRSTTSKRDIHPSWTGARLLPSTLEKEAGRAYIISHYHNPSAVVEQPWKTKTAPAKLYFAELSVTKCPSKHQGPKR
ncbi:hypothetical protein VTJ04DRAFT_10111 [Mycothermus thermophilus]|uniref:uncharacterized protein n=1 Tax=Humicola insolens TaxID=85995 RepID=UPI00374463DC